jgi:hypothetical protein
MWTSHPWRSEDADPKSLECPCERGVQMCSVGVGAPRSSTPLDDSVDERDALPRPAPSLRRLQWLHCTAHADRLTAGRRRRGSHARLTSSPLLIRRQRRRGDGWLTLCQSAAGPWPSPRWQSAALALATAAAVAARIGTGRAAATLIHSVAPRRPVTSTAAVHRSPPSSISQLPAARFSLLPRPSLLRLPIGPARSSLVPLPPSAK